MVLNLSRNCHGTKNPWQFYYYDLKPESYEMLNQPNHRPIQSHHKPVKP
nr:MAG TPA: 40S ribosomal protein S30 [Caudoviricetes sp.]